MKNLNYRKSFEELLEYPLPPGVTILLDEHDTCVVRSPDAPQQAAYPGCHLCEWSFIREPCPTCPHREAILASGKTLEQIAMDRKDAARSAKGLTEGERLRIEHSGIEPFCKEPAT